MVQTTARHGGCGGGQRRIVRHHGLRRGTHRLRFLKRLDSAAYKMAASQAEITESLITDSDGVRKVYNSAAIAFPDGHADSYQKMHRAGSEETAWSLPGSTPVMFEMPEWTGSTQGRYRHLSRRSLLSGTRSLLCRVWSRTVPASDGHDRQRMVSRIPHGQLYRP